MPKINYNDYDEDSDDFETVTSFQKIVRGGHRESDADRERQMHNKKLHKPKRVRRPDKE